MLELHGAIAGAVPCQARILLVAPDLLREVTRAVPRFDSMQLPDPALANAFSALWGELGRPVKSSHVAAKCRGLLQELVHRHGQAEGFPSAANRMDLAIRRAVEHLRRHVVEPQALQDLAVVARVSKSYLVREFHRVVGLPPHAYHLQLRIARAARLLATGLSLSRVAVEAGFADQSHLSRRFKAAYGLTPLDFARSVRPMAPVSFASAGRDVA
jgi:transcriptional regulator GlxA family with amidase domain